MGKHSSRTLYWKRRNSSCNIAILVITFKGKMRLLFLFAFCFCCASAWIDGDWCFPGAKLTDCNTLNGVGGCVKKICNDNNEWEEVKLEKSKRDLSLLLSKILANANGE